MHNGRTSVLLPPSATTLARAGRTDRSHRAPRHTDHRLRGVGPRGAGPGLQVGCQGKEGKQKLTGSQSATTR